MEIFSNSFVIDFESIAADPDLNKSADQLRNEFNSDPSKFIDNYIEDYTEFFRPIDLGIINDPMQEETIGYNSESDQDEDQSFEENILNNIDDKTLTLDDIIQITRADAELKQIAVGNNIFDLSSPLILQNVTNIEKIDLTGNGAAKLIVDTQGVIDLTGDTNTLIIIGDDGDEVSTKGDWISQGMINIDGHNYVQYTCELGEDVATLLIHSNMTQSDFI